MTEMGLGGAVACAALDGYHIREADLLVEILDPATGKPVPDGSVGEVVFTTLTRKGMPLIRYRTGDLAAFATGICACGTMLKTLSAVRGRVVGAVDIGTRRLHLAELDETLFEIESVLNFTVHIDRSEGAGKIVVGIRQRAGTSFEDAEAMIRKALLVVPAIRAAVAASDWCLHIRQMKELGAVSSSIKRQIHDQRQRTP
jgi:phenylacetate-coenzyme A ligase PaaK-like adenylate-forming protein